MPRVRTSTTPVLMSVARFEFRPARPTFPRIGVRPAKKAEPRESNNHEGKDRMSTLLWAATLLLQARPGSRIPGLWARAILPARKSEAAGRVAAEHVRLVAMLDQDCASFSEQLI